MSKRRPVRWAGIGLLGLLLLAGPLAAQTVQGILRTVADSAPAPGALVLLLDSTGVEQARTVSYGSGGYSLSAAAAGSYHLRVLRIGSLPFESPSFALAAGQVLAYPVTLPRSPVVLTEIVVASHSDCRLYPDSETTTGEVWREVRKALAITVETMRHGPYRFTTSIRRLYFDPDMRLIRGDSVPGPRLEQWPVVSWSPDSLAEHGYVRRGDVDMIYYGIDPGLLFSTSFLDRHCFHLVREKRNDSLIGLAFEPVRGISRPDVKGTLWLSKDDAELRYLEFSYVNLERWIPREKTGGRLDFMRLANGAWLVRQWWMQAPRRQDRPGMRRPAVAGWTVWGGRVTQVLDREGHLLRTIPPLSGR